jgi:hypothetical protein
VEKSNGMPKYVNGTLDGHGATILAYINSWILKIILRFFNQLKGEGEEPT